MPGSKEQLQAILRGAAAQLVGELGGVGAHLRGGAMAVRFGMGVMRAQARAHEREAIAAWLDDHDEKGLAACVREGKHFTPGQDPLTASIVD